MSAAELSTYKLQLDQVGGLVRVWGARKRARFAAVRCSEYSNEIVVC